MGQDLTAFPSASYPFVDNTGKISQPWLQFLIALYNRTGGTLPDTPGDSTIQNIMLAGAGDDTAASVSQSAALLSMLSNAPAGFSGANYGAAQLAVLSQIVQPASDLTLQAFMFGLMAGREGDTARSMAVVTPTVGASPFAYSAPSEGFAIVSGGTVSDIEFSRDGIVFISTGETSGTTPVRKKDVIRVTFTVAPAINFVPTGA